MWKIPSGTVIINQTTSWNKVYILRIRKITINELTYISHPLDFHNCSIRVGQFDSVSQRGLAIHTNHINNFLSYLLLYIRVSENKCKTVEWSRVIAFTELIMLLLFASLEYIKIKTNLTMKRIAKFSVLLVVSVPATNKSTRTLASCSYPSDSWKLEPGLPLVWKNTKKNCLLIKTGYWKWLQENN